MNRREYMGELERLLADIPLSEKEEALQYYNDYLDDAGVENEEEVIASLGTPESVAANIKEGLFEETAVCVVPEAKEERKKDSNGTTVLLIVLGILAAPIVIPLAFAAIMVVFALIVTLLAVVFAILITFAALTFALLITGVLFAGLGIAKIFVTPMGGITLLGGGLLCAGIGLVFLVLTIWMVGKAIPAVVRFIANLFKKLFNKKGGAKA